MRSHRAVGHDPAVGAGGPGTSPSSVISVVRRRPRRSSSSSSASTRGHHALADASCPGRPFHGMPAASSWCSTSRAYGPVGGEQHGDAVEAGAGAGGVDDGAHGDAHLVVGVGGRDDLDVDRRGGGRPPAAGQRVAGEPLGEGDDRGVGVGVAGEAEQELDVAALGERGEQAALERAQALGEVDDDAAEARRAGRARARVGGPGEEVALVVPLAGEQAGDLGGDPRRLAAARRAGERGQRRRPATRSSRYRSRRATTVDGWWLTPA